MITLDVPLDRFPDELRRRMPSEAVFLREHRGVVILTAADVAQHLILRAESGLARKDVEAFLLEHKIEWSSGVWRLGDSGPEEGAASSAYVAAVAYRSTEAKPGCWMDAYDSEPTVQEVLTNLFEEFRINGEVRDIAFEDFLRLAAPNVVILKPEEIRYHVVQKQSEC